MRDIVNFAPVDIFFIRTLQQTKKKTLFADLYLLILIYT